MKGWLHEALTGQGWVDAKFENVDGGYVFDSGWIGGKVLISPQEEVVIRHNLYLLSLVPLATTVPMLAYVVATSAKWMPLLFGQSVGGAVLQGALVGLLVSFGVLIRYPYIAMAVKGKERYEPRPDT